MISVTDASCSFSQYLDQHAGSSVVMATIQEVRQAEKKVGEALEALKNSDVRCPDELALELQRSTDEYARAVRELK